MSPGAARPISPDTRPFYDGSQAHGTALPVPNDRLAGGGSFAPRQRLEDGGIFVHNVRELPANVLRVKHGIALELRSQSRVQGHRSRPTRCHNVDRVKFPVQVQECTRRRFRMLGQGFQSKLQDIQGGHHTTVN